jgi:hypothetical protein
MELMLFAADMMGLKCSLFEEMIEIATLNENEDFFAQSLIVTQRLMLF